jgi:serine/threonine protein phosphatase 1
VATFAIGDIHGHLEALVDLLGQIVPLVQPDDTVVFLGDYVDRGPDSKGCIDAILRLKRTLPGRVVCLKGNHEDWLLATRQDHRKHSWLPHRRAC